MYKSTSHHDSFFCNMMEIKAVAQSFFMSQLPPAISEALDWDTLQIAESARRHPGRKTSYTDITYQCRTKKEGILIFLHCEQQRNYEIMKMVERNLCYNAGFISQHRRQGNKKLPVIINFVIYNNPKASMKPHPMHSWEYSEIPWMAKLFHDRYYLLLNLKQIPDEILANYGPCGVMLLLLKRAEERNFIEWVKEHAHLMPAMGLAEVYDLSINYVLQVGTGEVQAIIDTFTELFPQHKKTTMTAARQLEKRGKIQIARNMLLKLHLDMDIVQKATELSKAELDKILHGRS